MKEDAKRKNGSQYRVRGGSDTLLEHFCTISRVGSRFNKVFISPFIVFNNVLRQPSFQCQLSENLTIRMTQEEDKTGKVAVTGSKSSSPSRTLRVAVTESSSPSRTLRVVTTKVAVIKSRRRRAASSTTKAIEEIVESGTKSYS